MVHAGPAMATVDVDNLANFNAADVSCGCILGGLTAKIAGNGASAGSPTFSSINANLAKVLALSQGNGAGIGNNVAGNAKSGDNSASLNTGAVADDPSVISQGATSDTNVSNLSNWNSAGTGATVGLPGGSSLNLLMDFSALLALLSL